MEVSKLTKSRMHRRANASRIHMADKVVCTLVASMCLALGAVVGELLDIEEKFNTFGEWLKVKGVLFFCLRPKYDNSYPGLHMMLSA